MENKITNKDNFLSKMKQKFDKKGVDEEALVAKKTSIGEILEGNTLPPEKLFVAGPVGKTSVRPSKVNENKLSGKDGKQMKED